MLKEKCLVLICLFFSLITLGQQLVLPGDHSDPTVIKIGDTYWTSTTSSNWFPAYPIYQSKDLVNWKLTGHVFDILPAWAD